MKDVTKYQWTALEALEYSRDRMFERQAASMYDGNDEEADWCAEEIQFLDLKIDEERSSVTG